MARFTDIDGNYNRETELFKYSYAGTSNDQRTNRWKFECKGCGKVFVPPTTIMATQLVGCPNPKCKNEEVINYNKED